MLYKLHWLIVDVFINETRDVLYNDNAFTILVLSDVILLFIYGTILTF